MKQITIIGGGASGTLLAANLLKSGGGPLAINIVERNDRLGRGVAYSTDKDSHLLNVPAAKMGAFPEDVEGFHRWLGQNGFAYDGNDFVPRRIFGRYLRDVLSSAAKSASPETEF